MVAFAGHKYAARSLPVQVADSTHTITSFTLVNIIKSILSFHWHSPFTFSSSFSVSLVIDSRCGSLQVLEFQKGTLQNLYWKKFGCDSCPGTPLSASTMKTVQYQTPSVVMPGMQHRHTAHILGY